MDHVKSGLFLLAASFALSGQDGKIGAEAARKMKNPVPFTKKSIAQGRDTFLRNCVGCHGDDGKALIDVVANATDLTDPKAYRDGTTDGEIFRSIRDGAGASMPSFKSEIERDQDMWNLVNFIHSLWPADVQPQLHKESK